MFDFLICILHFPIPLALRKHNLDQFLSFKALASSLPKTQLRERRLYNIES